jgi:hypothetical protein
MACATTTGRLPRPVKGLVMSRTPKEIIYQTNDIARIIYKAMGYIVPVGTEFPTETINRHPHERACWQAACEIQDLMTATDPNDALDELE